MHALIDARQIPAEKTDDFFLQTAKLEQVLGDHAYTHSRRRYDSAKKGPAIVVGVALLIALCIYGMAMLGPTDGAIAQTVRRVTSDHVLFAAVIGIAALLLLIGTAAARFYRRSLATKLLGKDLSAWWTRVLQRWAPELAATHDLANIDPASIAQLVAVQIRIQDVNLDLH